MREQLYLVFRDLDVRRGGPVVDGGWFSMPVRSGESDFGWGGGLAPSGRAAYGFRPVDGDEVAHRLGGRALRFVIHGFNVDRNDGFRANGLLGELLDGPDADAVDVGVLWPGDFAIPVINYPFEFGDARETARLFARRLREVVRWNVPIRFVTHSFGFRVAMETLLAYGEANDAPLPVQELFFTAGADDSDVLGRSPYARALEGVERVVNLSSLSDRVLAGAFPFGDVVEAALWAGQETFRKAIGLVGPRAHGFGERLVSYRSGAWGHDHSDYLPYYEDELLRDRDREAAERIRRREAVAALIRVPPERRPAPEAWARGARDDGPAAGGPTGSDPLPRQP